MTAFFKNKKWWTVDWNEWVVAGCFKGGGRVHISDYFCCSGKRTVTLTK